MIASDAVPRDTALTDLVRYPSIDRCAEDWISQMTAFVRLRDYPSDGAPDLAARGYGIPAEAKRLASIWTEGMALARVLSRLCCVRIEGSVGSALFCRGEQGATAIRPPVTVAVAS